MWVSLSLVSVSFKNFSLLFSLPSPLQINAGATSESQPPTTSLRPDTPRLIPLLRDACGWSRRLVLTSGSSSTSIRILIWRTETASKSSLLSLFSLCLSHPSLLSLLNSAWIQCETVPPIGQGDNCTSVPRKRGCRDEIWRWRCWQLLQRKWALMGLVIHTW